MSSSLQNICYFDEEAIKAENDHLEIILVPGWGSNLISIMHKETQREVLRSPRSSEEFWANPVLFGVPILFPPNRISDGTFTFRGRVYRFNINEKDKNNHIHGFLNTKKWQLVRTEATENELIIETKIESDLLSYPSIYQQFPHHFSIQMSYRLKKTVICKDATIINHGKDPFPWGLGYHTTFLFPEENSSFAVTAEKRWKLDERFLPTGELEDLENKAALNQGISIKEVKFKSIYFL